MRPLNSMLVAAGIHGAAALQGAGADSSSDPVNRWELLHEEAPNIVWENGVAWDPDAARIVWHGGHIGRLYPQSNYTFLYDPAANRFHESQAPSRPQRRCLIHVAYLDGPRRVVTSDGGVSHGSIPSGGLGGDYQRVFRADARGPWLYDALNDTWEDCRPLPPAWKRKAHAPVAYEPNSDALFGLRDDLLVVYSPRLNRVFTKPLPQPLQRLTGYGLAADPLHRKLVLFGGKITTKRPQQVDGRNVYDTVTCNHTWVYDIAADSWRECSPGVSPPKGVPAQDMLSLQMVWHDASGTVLLLQNATDAAGDNSAWPPAELWSFDTKTEQWSRVEVAGDGPRPAFMGLLVYAREIDRLFLFGGGRDGVGDEGSSGARPALSRQVWSIRVRLPGRAPAAAAPLLRPRVGAAADGVTVSWDAAPGAGQEIWRAACAPLPGAYERLAAGDLGGSYRDTTAAPGQVYAYLPTGPRGARIALPAFNQPWRPAGLAASVEAGREVRLRWLAETESDTAGYRVYRARGAEVERGAGQLLTPEPLREARFVDTSVNLDDGVIHSYWVTAVNAAGIESGASPLAYTAPDAPAGLAVPEGVGPSDNWGVRHNYVVGWQWPRDIKVAGFNVYGAVDIPNGSSPEVLQQTWKKLTPQPVAAREFVYRDPPEGPACRYFHVRAVNALGQEGFSTDIVSPTDRRFRP